MLNSQQNKKDHFLKYSMYGQTNTISSILIDLNAEVEKMVANKQNNERSKEMFLSGYALQLQDCNATMDKMIYLNNNFICNIDELLSYIAYLTFSKEGISKYDIDNLKKISAVATKLEAYKRTDMTHKKIFEYRLKPENSVIKLYKDIEMLSVQGSKRFENQK